MLFSEFDSCNFFPNCSNFVAFLVRHLIGAEYGAVTALGINMECTRLLCGHARGQVGYPFKSQYPHTNSPNWSSYISLENELREFGKRSSYFLFGDHFINSHNLIS